MDKIIQTLKQIPDWISKYQYYNRVNHIEFNLINRLQFPNIECLNKHLQKLSQQNQQKQKISWVSSQYQALQIVLNSISVISDKKIQDFNHREWDQISQIFRYKTQLTIKYQSLRIIMQKKQQRRRWCVQQQNFLIEIVKGHSRKNKWNDVARQLFIKSHGQFFRQGKHCRQRWLNHLHPSIQKQFIIKNSNNWSMNQDIKLLNLILKKGKKWARLAKKFDMRKSQCMVKKRFFELINIDESNSLNIQILKSEIRKVLQRLNEEIAEKSLMIKQNDSIEMKCQKEQLSRRQCWNLSQFAWKSLKHDNFSAKQNKIENEDVQDNNIQKTTPQIPSGNFFTMTDYKFQQPSYIQIMNYQLRTYWEMFRSYPSPSFLPFTQFIMPIQNNIIINNSISKDMEFHKK